MKTTEQRFWDKINKTDECWEWTAQLSPTGYGRIQIDYKAVAAHRYSAELHGMDITDKIVCHKCDNPCCVRPDHLFVGTQKDNMQDMIKKGRKARVECYPANRKLTDDDVRFIRASELDNAALGRMYNLRTQSVWKIVHRKTYKDVN